MRAFISWGLFIIYLGCLGIAYTLCVKNEYPYAGLILVCVVMAIVIWVLPTYKQEEKES